jgi:4a-hydroxytetrahydrobiopterin dehydratase
VTPFCFLHYDCAEVNSVALLSNDELRQQLDKLNGWGQNGNAIVRRFEFADFKAAMAFVNKIADAAEAANHHPDITINYNKVTLLLTSHDSGGVTDRDARMAAKIDQVVGT